MHHPCANEPTWELYKDRIGWTRPLLGAEQTLDQFSRLANGLDELAMGISFTSQLPATAIEKRALEAIGRLRFSSPLIAAKILPGIHHPEFRSWVYHPATDASEVRDWAHKTLRITLASRDSDIGAYKDFVSKLTQVPLPYTDKDAVPDQHWYCHLVLRTGEVTTPQEANTHALFIHSTHAMTDGVTCLAILHLLLETIASGIEYNSTPIADLHWGKEVENLTPGPVAVVGGIKHGWEEDGAKLMEARYKALTNPQPTHSLKPQRTEIVNTGKAVRAHRALDKNLSTRLVQAAKTVGYSITQLWDAAQVIATFEYNPELLGDPDPAKQHVTLFPALVSLRHLVQPPEKQRTIPGVLALCIPLVIPLDLIQQQANPRDRLLAVMQSLKSQYATQLSNPHLPVLEPVAAIVAPVTTLFPGLNPYWGKITNIGVIEARLPTVWNGEDESGRKSEAVVKVDELFLGLREMSMRPMTHVWTIHSEIHLQIEGCDIWDKEYLKGFLARVIAVASTLIISDEQK